MQVWIGYSVVLAAIVAAPAGRAATNLPRDVAAVRTAELAMASTVQIDRLVRFYAPDAVLIDAFTPGLSHGRNAVRAEFLPQLAPLTRLAIDTDDMSIVTEGDYACVLSQQRIAVTARGGGVMHTAFRLQDIWHRTGGTWSVIQEHVGYPVDTATGLGVMDAPITPMRSVAWAADPFASPPVDVAAMTAALQSWQQRHDAAQTAAAAMSSFDPGSALRDVDAASPGVGAGARDIERNLRARMTASRTDDTLTQFHAVGDGSFAAVYSVHEAASRSPDGAVSHTAYRESDCLHRVDGHWLAYQEMRSYPLDIRTGKAVTWPPP